MRKLPTGIVPIVQTPFLETGEVDLRSFECLVEDAIDSGATGLVYPAVASEVGTLSLEERQDLVRRMVSIAAERVSILAGISSQTTNETRTLAEHAATCGADGVLIQPTPSAQRSTESLIAYLHEVTERIDLPVILQDLDWTGPGLAMETILRTVEEVPTLRGIKVETVPAGPKYAAIRNATSGRLHISGGWAVTQMIDGLNRGLDALMPEASMVRIYRAIWDTFHAGDPSGAAKMFDRIAGVLLFSNQHIDVSIQFFKRVLHRRGIFTTTVCRGVTRRLDAIQTAQADRLAKIVVDLLASMPSRRSGG